MRLSTAVEEYLKELKNERAAETYRVYRGTLELLKSFAITLATDSITAFTQKLVVAYFTSRSEKGLSASSRLRERAAISEFARWCLRQRLLTDDPMLGAPRIKRPVRQPRPYEHAERDRLLALELGPEETMLRGLLYYAGLRVSEISELRWPAVRLTSEDKRGALRIIGKGNKERIVPILGGLEAILRTYAAEPHQEIRRLQGGYVLSNMGSKWAVRMIENRVRRWGELAKVAKSTPHRWRHTCATLLFELGLDVRLVQQFLGHSNIATTMLYTQVSDSMMDRALSAIESRQRCGHDARNRIG